jgi:hypothetical protein
VSLSTSEESKLLFASDVMVVAVFGRFDFLMVM